MSEAEKTNSELESIKIELKEAYAQLEKVDQLKSDFISTVSHELRTPLAAIKEGVDIVIDGTAGALNPKQREFLSISKRNIDRLVRLINSILDFQRLEAGKMVFIFAGHDINSAVKKIKENMLPLVLDKELDFILELEDNLPLVNFDYDKIMQVLTNLVGNAIQVTKEGHIRIATVKGDNFVQVTVGDTCTGIIPEDIPKLFRQFGQIESGLERRTGGTGLGLVISREIIEAHKGRIWVESEFGKGAAFHFVLPIVDHRK
ncbi:MAG: HAMP domain-containing sensor histidine kinase [Candidatus Omnitrophota bacterium]